jgi:hypothetical protein
METVVRKLLIGLLAVVLSLITFYFVNGWYNLFFWAFAALAIGYTSKDRRNAVTNGAILGYFIVLAYIFAGYKGKTDSNSLVHFILFNVVFSLVGSAGCIFGAFAGTGLKGN